MLATRVSLALALLAAPLAGCMDGEEPTGNPPNGTNPPGGNRTWTVEWTNHPGDSDGPADTAAGNLASFTWQVRGPREVRITRTEVCWDDASHAEAAPGGIHAAYNMQCAPGYQSVAGDYPLAADINRQVIAPAPGTWYARVWAMADGQAVAGPEVTWTIVEPAQTTVSIPKPPPGGGNVAVTWRVNGPAANVQETGLVWGSASIPDAEGSPRPQPTGEYGGGRKTVAPVDAPATFTAQLPAEGTTYYRTYAVVGGTTHWSHEHVA